MQQIFSFSNNKITSTNSLLEIDSSSKERLQDFVIIDPRIENLNSLVRGIKPEATIIVLSLERDGVRQLDYLINNYSQINSLHLITHGTPGNIQLGATELNLTTLKQYEATIKSWSSSLANTSLFIYGCNVAQNDTGKIFLQSLHHLTTANIAAATHKVGNPERGGNWDLDYHIGEVGDRSIFLPKLIRSYSGTFDPVVSLTTSPEILIETEGTVFTYTFELSEPPPQGGVNVTVTGNVPESLNQFDLLGGTVQTTGADFPAGDFDFSGFDLNITEQTATLSLPIFEDDDTTDAIFRTPEFDDDDFTVTYTLEPGEGYTVNPDANSGTVSFFDTPEDVPEPEPEPEPDDNIEVSLEASEDTLIESEGTETTITISLNSPPPEDGLVVDIGSEVPSSLGDFNLLPPEPQAEFTGGQLVEGFEDNSGFSFRLDEQTATITLPIFDDEDRPSDDPDATRNDDIGVENITYSLLEDDSYDINPDSSEISLTLADTPEQLEETPSTIDLFRFRNTTFDTGTYLFVGEEERDNILEDENLSNTFELEGVQEDGTVIPAFTASLEDGDDLAPFYRIRSLDVPGTYLFVSTDEYEAIFAEDSEQQDKWEREGFDEAGEDIPEFYLYEGSADLGTEFNRFQNEQNGTFLYAGPEETNNIESDSNLSNIFTNQGIAFESLS